MYYNNLPILTLLGSCRITTIRQFWPCTLIHDKITFTHNTREIIQLFKIMRGELTIPPQINSFCFRTAITDRCEIMITDELKNEFNSTELYLMEICSNRLYNYKDYTLHHLAVDDRFPEFSNVTPEEIRKNTTITYQTPEEIESDLITIRKMIEPKKLLVVTHFNVLNKEGKWLKRRNELILNLKIICHKLNIPIFDPTIIFEKYKQRDIIQPDLGHLVHPTADPIVGQYFVNRIRELL